MKIKRWILIRGLTRSRYHWLGFDLFFKTELALDTVDCPEIPGNGYLASEQSLLSMDETVLNLRAQIAAITEPVGLLGVSMGGMIGTRWAEMFPNEIAQLVLVNTSSQYSPFYERLRPQNYLGILKTLFVRDPRSAENFIMMATSNQPAAWKPYLIDLIKFRIKHTVTRKNFITQLRLSSKANFPSKKPIERTLILTSKSDNLVSYHCSQKIAEAWKTPIEIHPSAGHDLTLDAPNWICTQIKNH